jgi:hypothetical protein
MQDGNHVIDSFCPHCGGTIWRIEYVEFNKVRLACDGCFTRGYGQKVWDAGGKQDVRQKGLYAGIHASKAEAPMKRSRGRPKSDKPRPWEEAGVPKATWYRRQKDAK